MFALAADTGFPLATLRCRERFMIWTLPNILTLLRLFAAPLLVLAVLLLPRPYADIVAVLLFVGASATDWIDGYLARKWDQTSKLGTMLDPIADKAMVAVALLILVTYSSLNFLILLFVVALCLWQLQHTCNIPKIGNRHRSFFVAIIAGFN